MKKTLTKIICLVVIMFVLTSCTEAERVNHNLAQSAGNFNITRTITVFNTRTDKVLFQMTGRMDIENNSTNELVVICEQDEGVYKKHFIYLSPDTTYVVEDVTGAYADKYFYEFNVNPLLWSDFIKPVYQN